VFSVLSLVISVRGFQIHWNLNQVGFQSSLYFLHRNESVKFGVLAWLKHESWRRATQTEISINEVLCSKKGID